MPVNPKVTLSLAETIKSSSELVKVMESLRLTATSVLGEISKAAESLNNVLSQTPGVGQSTAVRAVPPQSMAQPGPEQDLDTASKFQYHLGKDEYKHLKRMTRIALGMPKGSRVADDDMTRAIQEGRISGFHVTDDGIYKKGQEHFLPLKIASRIPPQQANLPSYPTIPTVTTPSPVQEPAATTGYARDIASIGYSRADLPRLFDVYRGVGDQQSGGQATGVMGGIQKALDGLSKSTDENTKLERDVLSKALEGLSKELSEVKEVFGKATDEYKNAIASGDKDRVAAAQSQLLSAGAKLESTQGEIDPILKRSKNIGGGGGDEDLPSGMDKFRKWFASIGGVIGGLVSAGATGLVSATSAATGMQLSIEQSRASSAQSAFQSAAESADLMNANNVVKNFGAMLYRGSIPEERLQYLTSNPGAAALEAFKNSNIDWQRKKFEYYSRNIQGGLQVAGGAIVAGASLDGGLATNAIGAGAGVASMISGVNSTIANNISSDYAKATGQGYMSQLFGWFSGKETQEQLPKGKTQVGEGNVAGQLDYIRSLQAQQAAQLPSQTHGLQQFLDLQRGQLRAATLAGGDYLSANAMYKIAADVTQNNEDIEKKFRNYSSLEKVSYMGETYSAVPSSGFKSKPEVVYQDGHRIVRRSKERVSGYVDQMTGKFIPASEAQVVGREDRPTEIAMTPWANLGMAATEYQELDARAQQALGMRFGRRAGGAASQLRTLALAGFGSEEQNASALMHIGNVTGVREEDRLRKLKEIFAEGTKVGFDKSLGQNLLQATLSLSDSLKTTDTTGVSEALSRMALLMSPDRTAGASELGLKRATEGMQSYAGITGERGGAAEALRMRAIMGSDMLSSEYNYLSGLNAMQLREAQNQLKAFESGKTPLEKLTSTTAIDLIYNKQLRGNKSALSKTIAQLGNVIEAAEAPITASAGINSPAAEAAVSEFKKSAIAISRSRKGGKGKLDKQQKSKFNDVLNKFRAAINANVPAETAAAYSAKVLAGMDDDFISLLPESLQKQINSGAGSIPEGMRRQQAARDKWMSDGAKRFNDLATAKDVQEFLRSGDKLPEYERALKKREALNPNLSVEERAKIAASDTGLKVSDLMARTGISDLMGSATQVNLFGQHAVEQLRDTIITALRGVNNPSQVAGSLSFDPNKAGKK